jgi:hypothetical protein
MFSIQNKEEVLERMQDKYIIDEATGCWNWIAACRDSARYGAMKINGSVVDSHRISYAVYNGDIEDGICVCHKCDNMKCINPNHLFLGTKDDNNKDMFKKGRYARGDNSGARLHPESVARGENAYFSKLSEYEVTNILNDYYFSLKKVKDICIQYKVDRGTIADITQRRTWVHVYNRVMGDMKPYIKP